MNFFACSRKRYVVENRHEIGYVSGIWGKLAWS